MKKVLFISILLLSQFFITCCTFPSYSLESECKPTKEDFISTMTALFVKYDFNIKATEVNSGYIKADKMDGNIWVGNRRFEWTVNYLKNKMIAKFKIYISENDNGTSYADDIPSDLVDYWNIRNEMNSICGAEVMILKDGKEYKKEYKENRPLEREPIRY